MLSSRCPVGTGSVIRGLTIVGISDKLWSFPGIVFTELGRVEQWSAWRAHIPKVGGSNPPPASFECGAMALCLCPPCNVKALCAIRSTEGFLFATKRMRIDAIASDRAW